MLGTLFGAALLAANISPSTHVLLAFAFFLTEGAIYDWSGVFLRTALGVDLSAELIGLQKLSSWWGVALILTLLLTRVGLGVTHSPRSE